MNRRRLLKVASGAIATASACIVGIPGAGYVIATVRRHSRGNKTIQRVIRLNDLPIGRPVALSITGGRRDAWTAYPKQTVGRVWLWRKATAPGQQPKFEVAAYSATCPHLGCAVRLSSSGKSFDCPCHRAGFDLAGRRLSDHELGHANPPPRDLDVLECRVVEDDSGEQWVEVAYEKFKLGLTEKVPQA